MILVKPFVSISAAEPSKLLTDEKVTATSRWAPRLFGMLLNSHGFWDAPMERAAPCYCSVPYLACLISMTEAILCDMRIAYLITLSEEVLEVLSHWTFVTSLQL